MKTGRPPKPAGQARNRNKPTHAEVYLPPGGRGGRVPTPMGATLKPEAVKLWRRLWKTPEASQWGDADVPALTRYVSLAIAPDLWLEKGVLGELRQLEDRFGLNPYGRRVSKWVIDDEPATEDAPVLAVVPDAWRSASTG